MDFKLIPEEVPRASKGGSRYDKIIDQFSLSGVDSARIECKSVDAKKLAMGLRTRVRTRKLENIGISQRGSKVYIRKK